MSNLNRYNFKKVEKNWQSFWEKNKTFKAEKNLKKKNFTVLKCFHTLLGKFTWVMLETIQ